MTDITARKIARNAATIWTRKAAALLVKAQEIDMNPHLYMCGDAEDCRAEARKAERLARQWRAKAEQEGS